MGIFRAKNAEAYVRLEGCQNTRFQPASISPVRRRAGRHRNSTTVSRLISASNSSEFAALKYHFARALVSM